MNDPSRGQYLPLLPPSQAIPGASKFRVTRVRCPCCQGKSRFGDWLCTVCHNEGKASRTQIELAVQRLETRRANRLSMYASNVPGELEMGLRELAAGMSYRTAVTGSLPPERLAD